MVREKVNRKRERKVYRQLSRWWIHRHTADRQIDRDRWIVGWLESKSVRKK